MIPATHQPSTKHLQLPTDSKPLDALRENRRQNRGTRKQQESPERGSWTQTTSATEGTKHRDPKPLGETINHVYLRAEMQGKPCDIVLSEVGPETLRASWRPPAGPEKMYDCSKRTHSFQCSTKRLHNIPFFFFQLISILHT